MNSSETPASAPLRRLTDAEIEDLLRGFSDSAITSARALVHKSDDSILDECLFGILSFYLPAGKEELPDVKPTEETRLRDDLGLDSLSMAEAMFKIEELFDIRVENAEMAEVITLSDARTLLLGKLESKKQTTSDE